MSAWEENPRILISKEGHKGAKRLAKRRGEPTNVLLEILIFRENHRLDLITRENLRLDRARAKQAREQARKTSE